MNAASVANVRNFVILGHSGTGKTALTDALAFKLGLNDRMGLVSNKTSIADNTDEEKERLTTLFSSSFDAPFEHNGQTYRMIFMDTPGFMDFYGQVICACSACDFALITVDAAAGVQVGTHRVWQACKKNGVKAIGFIVTGTDRDNANYPAAIAAIQEHFGASCLPTVVPDGKGGVIDILTYNALSQDLIDLKAQLIEYAAETDDTLTEKFLSGEELTAAEIAKGLDDAVIAGTAHPIFTVCPLQGTGIDQLLDNLCRLMPPPGSRPFTDTAGNEIIADASAPFTGYVWRSIVDPFLGHVNFIRVLSGTLKTGMELLNATTGEKETVSGMTQLLGKKQIPITEAIPGDSVAIPKFKNVTTGHTLTSPGAPRQIPPPTFPKPVTFLAIKAHTQADEDKMSVALHRIAEAYPTLQVEKNTETKEVILKGMGDIQLDVAISIMKRQSNVSVDTAIPKVAYRETITGKGDGHHRHKKQSGGRGQFGEVTLKVEPLPPGETDYFLNEIVGGAIPGNFIPAVKKGVDEGMLRGPLAGYPMQAIKIHLTDGSYHDVDSSEIAFKIAASKALREAATQARPVILEPIMTLTITIPDTFMGAINGDLTHKRGRIMGLESDGNLQIITAEAPLAELFKYAAELRSITGGQGTFEMAFTRYDIVPSNITPKIIADAAKDNPNLNTED